MNAYYGWEAAAAGWGTAGLYALLSGVLTYRLGQPQWAAVDAVMGLTSLVVSIFCVRMAWLLRRVPS